MKKLLNYALIFFVIIVIQLQLITNTSWYLGIITSIMCIVSYIIETYNKWEQKKQIKIIVYIATIIIVALLSDSLYFVLNIATIANIIFYYIMGTRGEKEFYIFNIIILILGILIYGIINEIWIISSIFTYSGFVLLVYEVNKKLGKIEFKYSDIIIILLGLILSISLGIYCIVELNNTITINDEMASILSNYNTEHNSALDDAIEVSGYDISSGDSLASSDRKFELISDSLSSMTELMGISLYSEKIYSNYLGTERNEAIETDIRILENLSYFADMLIENTIIPLLIECVIVYAVSLFIIYHKKDEFSTDTY